jgi:hypothetical protein
MSPPEPPDRPGAPVPPTAAAPAKKPNPFVEIAITIIAPAVILMQLSSTQRLGPLRALLLALAFPLAWGLWDAYRRRRLNWLSVLGVVSTMLTGGIGLLHLEARWLAVKEAAVPLAIGLAVLFSAWTRKPLIRILVFHADVFDVDKIHAALAERGTESAFDRQLRRGTMLLAGTFFFSAVANYLLATWMVTSPAGTEAFNQELGRLTLVSYPVIALPSMVMMMALMLWLARGAKRLTGLELEQMMLGMQQA